MGIDGRYDAIDSASCTTPRIEDIPLIVRREIEARAIAPFYDALVEEFGQERADRIVRTAVARLGEGSGRALAAERPADADPLAYYRDEVMPRFSAGGSMTWEDVELDAEAGTLAMDATRCAFAEMYRRLGLEHLGRLLSCERDPHMFHGYDERLEFTRTETLMEGCGRCDFRLRMMPSDTAPTDPER